MKTDSELAKTVIAELAWDPRIDEREIGVAASDGIVTLTGTVASYAEKLAAARAVERVAGVRAVANDVVVRVPDEGVPSDSELAHAVADALAWDIQVPDDKIKASVSQGWLTLDGTVEWRYQCDAAARAVNNIRGIRGVNNNIKVQPRGASATDVAVNIKKALERRADRTADRIDVTVHGDVVTLGGTVSSYADRRAAEGAAWSAPGVRDVRDDITIDL